MAPVASLSAPRARAMGEVGRVRLMQAATILLALAAWELAGASGLFFRGVLPSIPLILAAVARLLTGGAFWLNLATTAYEIGLAFVMGALLGAATGLALGASRFAGQVMEPILYYLAPAPKIVFLPVLLVLFGVGPGSKVAIGAMSCFFPVALGVAAGVRLVPPVYLRVGRTLRLGLARTIRHIYIPALLPVLSSSLRLGLGVTVVGCLLSEIKLSNRGLGFMAMGFYKDFDIASMLAVLVVVFLLAAALNQAIAFALRQPGGTSRT